MSQNEPSSFQLCLDDDDGHRVFGRHKAPSRTEALGALQGARKLGDRDINTSCHYCLLTWTCYKERTKTQRTPNDVIIAS